MNKHCSIEGCTQHMRGAVKGMCSMHYQRLYLKGDVGELKPKHRSRLKDKRSRKDIRLWYAHNISLEDYTSILESQNGVCAICGSTENSNEKWFYVDHDHKCCPTQSRSCGKCIRGLLCNNCNIGLGYFSDNSDTLRTAIKYLQKDFYKGRII
jgi:hypothetical protein